MRLPRGVMGVRTAGVAWGPGLGRSGGTGGAPGPGAGTTAACPRGPTARTTRRPHGAPARTGAGAAEPGPTEPAAADTAQVRTTSSYLFYKQEALGLRHIMVLEMDVNDVMLRNKVYGMVTGWSR